MKLTLAENIRLFRKERKMTQEKLAEALGVTVGAVYKWESGLSQPELGMLVELADLFDTSVDVLLGYKMKDNRIDSTLERLAEYCSTLDPKAIAEAEKALVRYPHSFKIRYSCAAIYHIFGINSHDTAQLRRALALYEEAAVLLPQNKDARTNETIISGNIALVMISLNEREKGLEMMKQNNAGGIFSSTIGLFLAMRKNEQEEAVPFLSEALVDSLSDLITASLGYLLVYRTRKDWDSALAVANWSYDLLMGLKADTQPGFLDKTQAELLAMLAYARLKAGLKEESHEALRKARDIAARFDSTPNYSLRKLRFAENTDQAISFDIFGSSAYESVVNLLELMEEPLLSAQWKEITEHE